MSWERSARFTYRFPALSLRRAAEGSRIIRFPVSDTDHPPLLLRLEQGSALGATMRHIDKESISRERCRSRSLAGRHTSAHIKCTFSRHSFNFLSTNFWFDMMTRWKLMKFGSSLQYSSLSSHTSTYPCECASDSFGLTLTSHHFQSAAFFGNLLPLLG